MCAVECGDKCRSWRRMNEVELLSFILESLFHEDPNDHAYVRMMVVSD